MRERRDQERRDERQSDRLGHAEPGEGEEEQEGGDRDQGAAQHVGGQHFACQPGPTLPPPHGERKHACRRHSDRALHKPLRTTGSAPSPPHRAHRAPRCRQRRGRKVEARTSMRTEPRRAWRFRAMGASMMPGSRSTDSALRAPSADARRDEPSGCRRGYGDMPNMEGRRRSRCAEDATRVRDRCDQAAYAGSPISSLSSVIG